MGKKRWLAIAVCAFAILAMFASTALAGEVTGSGKKENQNQGVSWCSFSGLNDNPTAPTDPNADPALLEDGPGGKSQSYGQEVKLGFVSPHELNPGVACNPNKTFLPPQPNRTK